MENRVEKLLLSEGYRIIEALSTEKTMYLTFLNSLLIEKDKTPIISEGYKNGLPLSKNLFEEYLSMWENMENSRLFDGAGTDVCGISGRMMRLIDDYHTKCDEISEKTGALVKPFIDPELKSRIDNYYRSVEKKIELGLFDVPDSDINEIRRNYLGIKDLTDDSVTSSIFFSPVIKVRQKTKHIDNFVV
ncbi:hypothetical protein M1293_02230 [Candidatus Parvarchaeota archaeon]|nr:hypothetical protein [Candidatus Parvarchaeota archaeon]